MSNNIQESCAKDVNLSKITYQALKSTFKPSHSLLGFYQMKKDIQVENSNKNSTMKTNVGDYTHKIMSVFST